MGRGSTASGGVAETQTIGPISRIEAIPLSVPLADLGGLVDTVIVTFRDEAGRYGVGGNDAPPDVTGAFIHIISTLRPLSRSSRWLD